MSYTALYRKFRPNTFSDVKGQEHIVTTLTNQVKNNHLSHAYLFTGTRGTGKTTVAKILAKAVNCENPVDGEPCGECEVCKAIAAGNSMNVVEMDAASNNGVENIRDLIEEISYAPTSGKYKVYIIDEVHMLTPNAFNALLKTLEEPPSYVIFILATTEVHKIPITILSRCQRYDFHRITIDTITARLQELMNIEGIEAEERALRYVAKVGDGSMRDALSLLDQCLAFHINEKLTYDGVLKVLGAVDTEVYSRLLRSVISRDVAGCINIIDQIITLGRDLNQFVIDFTWYMRNLLLIQSSAEMEAALDMSSDNLALLKEEAGMVEGEVLMRYIRIFSALSNEIRYSSQKRVLIEIAIIKLCNPSMENNYDSLINRIAQLEDKFEEGIPMAAGYVNPGPGYVEAAPIEKIKLPAALPEDLEEIKTRWKEIENALRDSGRVSLLIGKKPTITVTDGDVLTVIIDDKDGLSSCSLGSEKTIAAELLDPIQSVIGQKDIKIKVQFNTSNIPSKKLAQPLVDLSPIFNEVANVVDDL